MSWTDCKTNKLTRGASDNKQNFWHIPQPPPSRSLDRMLLKDPTANQNGKRHSAENCCHLVRVLEMSHNEYQLGDGRCGRVCASVGVS